MKDHDEVAPVVFPLVDKPVKEESGFVKGWIYKW